MEAFNIRHSGLDPESRMYFWIPAFAGMTGQFGRIFMQQNRAIGKSTKIIAGKKGGKV